MPSFDGWPGTSFNARAAQDSNILPIESFGSYVLVPRMHIRCAPCKTHPCRIHNVLDIFSLSQAWFNFRQTIMSRKLMQVME
jgi:hypothetical protein